MRFVSLHARAAGLLAAAVVVSGYAATVSVSAAPSPASIASPSIPKKVFDVTKYGALGNGKALNTNALQSAIDACSAAGGGEVIVPAGQFLTGPIHLASNLNLHLATGANILISDNPANFKLTNNRFEDCIVASKCHDVAITGSGTIDGQGAFWWKNYVKPKNAPTGTPNPPHRPFLVVLTGCQRVLVQGVTLQNSPMFHLVPQKCQDVRIDGIHISSPAWSKNTDGIDPSGWNFLITGCTIDVGDDCIALKPSGRISPTEPACRDFLIEHNTFLHGHGMSVGGQTPGGLENLTVQDCTFRGTDAGIRLKAPRGQGGLVENLTYRNLHMDGVKVAILITSYYSDNGPTSMPVDPAQDPAQPITATTPIWRHIRIDNVMAVNGKIAGEIFGLAEMPVSDIVLTNVSIAARNSFQIVHARGIKFVNSHVAVTNGAPVVLEDAQVTGIDRSGNSIAVNTPAAKPKSIFNIDNYGAVGDGKTKNTEAIARAITACASSGGGRVLIPAGSYLTGPIQLRSNVDLHVSPGALVIFSRDHNDYPLVVTHYEGLKAVRCTSPINGENLENVSITGEGVFDGGGETWRPVKQGKLPDDQWQALVASGGYVDQASGSWWPSRAAMEGQTAVPKMQASSDPLNIAAYLPYRDFLRPTLVEIDDCKNVLLDGPTFRNSPSWNIHILLSDNVTVRRITSFNYWWAQNGDGIDVDSCRHVALRDATFNAGDDGICLKSGKNEEGRRLHRPTEDVSIQNCTVYRGHGGVTIGSEMSGDVRNVVAKNCVFNGTDIGLRFKSTRGRGGVVENVTASDIDMFDIRGPAVSFDMYYEQKNAAPVMQPVDAGTPTFQNFKISDINCDGAVSAIVIRGLPERPIQDIAFRNVAITADSGVTCADAKGIKFDNVLVNTNATPAVVVKNSTDIDTAGLRAGAYNLASAL